jgi:hypothetical protein
MAMDSVVMQDSRTVHESLRDSRREGHLALDLAKFTGDGIHQQGSFRIGVLWQLSAAQSRHHPRLSSDRGRHREQLRPRLKYKLIPMICSQSEDTSQSIGESNPIQIQRSWVSAPPPHKQPPMFLNRSQNYNHLGRADQPNERLALRINQKLIANSERNRLFRNPNQNDPVFSKANPSIVLTEAGRNSEFPD